MALNAGPYTGRYASIKFSTADAMAWTATAVELLGKWDIVISLDTVDASVFGSVWKKNVCSMQGWTGKFEGFYSVSTEVGTTGQMVLQQAALDQLKIQNIRFYLNSTGDGSTGAYCFMPNYQSSHTDVTNYSTIAGCYIGNISVGQDKAGLATISYDIKGYGPLGLFCVTSSDGTLRAIVT